MPLVTRWSKDIQLVRKATIRYFNTTPWIVHHVQWNIKIKSCYHKQLKLSYIWCLAYGVWFCFFFLGVRQDVYQCSKESFIQILQQKLLTCVRISVSKGWPIRSIGVVITFSTFFAFIFKSTQFYKRLQLACKGCFPLGAIFPLERYFLCLLKPILRQLVFKQKKMSLRAENYAQWEMTLSANLGILSQSYILS